MRPQLPVPETRVVQPILSLVGGACNLQGYLAHKQHPPPQNRHRSLGMGLLGPTGGVFRMSEVPLLPNGLAGWGSQLNGLGDEDVRFSPALDHILLSSPLYGGVYRTGLVSCCLSRVMSWLTRRCT